MNELSLIIGLFWVLGGMFAFVTVLALSVILEVIWDTAKSICRLLDKFTINNIRNI